MADFPEVMAQGYATLVADGSEDAAKDELGYTNKHLHRRITDEDNRLSCKFDSEIFNSSTASPVEQNSTFEVTASGVIQIDSCEYYNASRWQTLIQHADFSIDAYNQITLLPTSTVVPAQAVSGTKLKIKYLCQCPASEGLHCNDYTLQVSGLNSFRASQYYEHTDIEGNPFETEIP